MKKNKEKNLLTKVAKGVAFGDTSNSAVRNILTEISKEIYGQVTNKQMHETMDFFDWRCPYTGIDLKPLIDTDSGGYAADHIYPQNQDWCGLNVQGNLILVDNAANEAKRGLDVETFLFTDTKVLKDLDAIGKTRQERLDKIKAFQAKFCYDPELIRKIVRPIMEERYKVVREEQKACINNILETLEKEGIRPLITKTPDKSKKSNPANYGGYTYNEKITVAYYYLSHNEGLVQVEENCMQLIGRSGATAKYILNKLGLDTSKKTSHKGLLIRSNLDDEISKATGTFKITLETIKKSELAK